MLFRSVLHWSPQHTFGLDGASGTEHGVDPDLLELERASGALAGDGVDA